MKIGEKTHRKIVEQIELLLRAYSNEIDLAYIKAEGKLDIKFKSTLSPDNKGVSMVTEISFRPEPDIKDRTAGFVADEDQMTIFEAEAEPCEPQLFVPKPKDWLWLVVGRARGLWFLPPNPDPDWLEITEGSLISDNWLHFCSERALDDQWFN